MNTKEFIYNPQKTILTQFNEMGDHPAVRQSVDHSGRVYYFITELVSLGDMSKCVSMIEIEKGDWIGECNETWRHLPEKKYRIISDYDLRKNYKPWPEQFESNVK